MHHFHFRLKFSEESSELKRKEGEDDPSAPVSKVLHVEPHVIPNRGPYPYNQPKK